MNTHSPLQSLFGRSVLFTLGVMLLSLCSIALQAQDDSYNRQNQRFQRNYYKRNEGLMARACHLLDRKRHHTPRKPLFASKAKPTNNAERVLSGIGVKRPVIPPVSVAKTEVKPEPPKEEPVSDQKLEKLHHSEDDVLANNKLPVPTSKKHEDIRKKVTDDLKNKPITEPRPLAPLYFQFNQDEFSVVDMEPFLIAVEYALQGRHVLIEGHTDSRGQDDFNVKLSVKRVQRIRQLMIDMGVPDDHISVVGYGEELVKDKSDKLKETEHQNNRRVDFTVF